MWDTGVGVGGAPGPPVSLLPRVSLSAFSSQDSQGCDVSVGACLEGVFVKHKSGRPPVVFRYSSFCALSVAPAGG